ncbi:MAG TPA: hypothetical protein VFL13_04650 [Candidatus Baltobacteraceae bacterium]|nr:hypothetical protein [Candidatus Baltobacteraceae bacterium]
MLALLFLAVLATPASPSPPPPAPMTPVQIYRAALLHIAGQPQPAFIDTQDDWKVKVAAPDGDHYVRFAERRLFDSAGRRECVLSLPYTTDSDTIVGESYFAPDMWLIRHPSKAPSQNGRSGFSPDLSDLHTIASVVSVPKPSYTITLAGVDALNNGGGTAYHLKLVPLDEPLRHNLRELWVNAQTFAVDRAVVYGDYAPRPLDLVERTTVTEDFGQVGPYWVMIHDVWTWRDAPNNVDFTYDASFLKMSFPDDIPGWYFDRKEFDKHRSEVNTTSQWP